MGNEAQANPEGAAPAPAAEAKGNDQAYLVTEARKAYERRDAMKKELDAARMQLAELQAKQSDDFKALAAQYRVELESLRPEYEALKTAHEAREQKTREQAAQALAGLPEKLRSYGEKLSPEDALSYAQTMLEEFKTNKGAAPPPGAPAPDLGEQDLLSMWDKIPDQAQRAAMLAKATPAQRAEAMRRVMARG